LLWVVELVLDRFSLGSQHVLLRQVPHGQSRRRRPHLVLPERDPPYERLALVRLAPSLGPARARRSRRTAERRPAGRPGPRHPATAPLHRGAQGPVERAARQPDPQRPGDRLVGRRWQRLLVTAVDARRRRRRSKGRRAGDGRCRGGRCGSWPELERWAGGAVDARDAVWSGAAGREGGQGPEERGDGGQGGRGQAARGQGGQALGLVLPQICNKRLCKVQP
ncbi:uncharacterized protein RHOBADRAFT_52763, partial [Rhodotorula graminis WP1]